MEAWQSAPRRRTGAGVVSAPRPTRLSRALLAFCRSRASLYMRYHAMAYRRLSVALTWVRCTQGGTATLSRTPERPDNRSQGTRGDAAEGERGAAAPHCRVGEREFGAPPCQVLAERRAYCMRLQLDCRVASNGALQGYASCRGMHTQEAGHASISCLICWCQGSSTDYWQARASTGPDAYSHLVCVTCRC